MNGTTGISGSFFVGSVNKVNNRSGFNGIGTVTITVSLLA